ncbi:PITH domain-containing protein 1 isoform X2 [Haliaeetus albicilla]|uniref:PITH domain-containing protein 1 isoform X2 n=1 Tax=Haliaeetus albicilla TaxID=8969 RepID=UPI0037E93102
MAARPGGFTYGSTDSGCNALTSVERAVALSSSALGRSGVTEPRFTGNVKLKGVIVMGEDDGTHPAEMRLFKNIPHMSFDDTAREPDQTFSLNRDLTGELEYPTKIARFSSVSHLSIHFPKNFGAETTKIFYIGLKGEWTEAHRHEVTICNYEASANPADHKLEQITPQTHFIS